MVISQPRVALLKQIKADRSFGTGPDILFPAVDGSWLTPILSWGPTWLVGLGDGSELIIVDAVGWMPWKRLPIPQALHEPPSAALLLPIGPSTGSPNDRFVVLTHEGRHWVLFDDNGRRLCGAGPAWCPVASPYARPLNSVPFTWTHAPPFVDLIGLDKDGALHASEFYLEDGRLELLATRVATTEGGYLAATRSDLRTVAAISRKRIDWLTYSSERCQVSRSLSNSTFSSAVACFPAVSPQEVLVVFGNGFVARVASPRRGNIS